MHETAEVRGALRVPRAPLMPAAARTRSSPRTRVTSRRSAVRQFREFRVGSLLADISRQSPGRRLREGGAGGPLMITGHCVLGFTNSSRIWLLESIALRSGSNSISSDSFIFCFVRGGGRASCSSPVGYSPRLRGHRWIRLPSASRLLVRRFAALELVQNGPVLAPCRACQCRTRS